MFEDSQEFKPKQNPNGIKLTLQAEICSSWGYARKKQAVEEIAKKLSNLGYDIKIQVVPIPGGTGIMRLSLIKEDGNKIIIFSNSKKDNETGAIVGYNIMTKVQDIIQKINSS